MTSDLTANGQIRCEHDIGSKAMIVGNSLNVYNQTTNSYPFFVDNTGYITGKNGINISADMGVFGKPNIISNNTNTITIGDENTHIIFKGDVDFTRSKLDKNFNVFRSLIFRPPP